MKIIVIEIMNIYNVMLDAELLLYVHVHGDG